MLKKQSIKVDNYEVFTDIGWKPIDFVHKTDKTKKYIVLFESGIEIECADKHAFIKMNNLPIMAKDLESGEKIISKDGYDIVFEVFETDEYDNFYDTTLNEHHRYFTNGILSHNTNLLVNMLERMSNENKNVIIFSLEMGEQALAQRIDSIGTLSDINKMYINKESIVNLAKQIKNNKTGKGKIIIKEFPTGQASTAHFRSVLREYQYRGITFDAIFCDYVTLMQPEYHVVGQLYQDGKRISEELRALSLEFMSPVISVSQLNREGIFIDFKEVDLTHIGESLGISAASDFMAIMGKNEDDLVYESELSYKIVKNRFGGRIGEMGKFYIDKKSLKMYDECELNLWMEHAKQTQDDRKVAQSY